MASSLLAWEIAIDVLLRVLLVSAKDQELRCTHVNLN